MRCPKTTSRYYCGEEEGHGGACTPLSLDTAVGEIRSLELELQWARDMVAVEKYSKQTTQVALAVCFIALILVMVL